MMHPPLDKLIYGPDLGCPIERSRDETEGFVYDVEIVTMPLLISGRLTVLSRLVG